MTDTYEIRFNKRGMFVVSRNGVYVSASFTKWGAKHSISKDRDWIKRHGNTDSYLVEKIQ